MLHTLKLNNIFYNYLLFFSEQNFRFENTHCVTLHNKTHCAKVKYLAWKIGIFLLILLLHLFQPNGL